MKTSIDEVADGIFRISTFLPDVTPVGFTMNQYLVRADEPLLFHTGPRGLFPLVREAMTSVLPPESLRWISFGHVESDECGAMNQWLEVAPNATVVHTPLAIDVSLRDLADREPRALLPDEVLDLGGRRVRIIATPHVPHNWEAALLFEEETGTLLCGDLFTRIGDGPALTDGDLVEPALQAEDIFAGTSLTPGTAPTIRGLAELQPRTLALMHGSAYSGDCVQALDDLAGAYHDRVLAGLDA